MPIPFGKQVEKSSATERAHMFAAVMKELIRRGIVDEHEVKSRVSLPATNELPPDSSRWETQLKEMSHEELEKAYHGLLKNGEPSASLDWNESLEVSQSRGLGINPISIWAISHPWYIYVWCFQAC